DYTPITCLSSPRKTPSNPNRQTLTGEVWMADVPGDKRRPVVVLTRDSVLPRLRTILVAPVTTRIREIPTEVPLGATHGLARPCVANFDNITPLPRQTLARRVGQLSEAELRIACRAARFAIDC
ncbi:MAG: type II toxin-antitoxin system PemK/MazF family toxin, partial [Pseudonocardiaceae bacterium]